MSGDPDNMIRIGDDALTDYFEGSVQGAIEHQRLDLHPDLRAYVVGLLTAFSQRKALRTDEDNDLLDAPVGIQVVRALAAGPGRRFQMLRQVGDYTLYVTGFFGDKIERGLVDRSYYVDVGAGAYRSAAGALAATGPENPFRTLFCTLSKRFVELMHLIEEVSERCFGQDTDVLRLYDRYVETGSQQIAARLARLGVPVGVAPKSIH